MSVSSLFLRSESLAKLTVLSLLFVGAVAPAPASNYVLDVEWTGDTFFTNFDFYTVRYDPSFQAPLLTIPGR
jgi:hypothetical protein